MANSKMMVLTERVGAIVGNYGYVEGPFSDMSPWGHTYEYFNLYSPAIRSQTGYPELRRVPEILTTSVERTGERGTNGRVFSELYGNERLKKLFDKPPYRLKMTGINTSMVKTSQTSWRPPEPSEPAYRLGIAHGSIAHLERVVTSIERLWVVVTTMYKPEELTPADLQRVGIISSLVTALLPYKDIWQHHVEDLRYLHSVPANRLSQELERIAEMGDAMRVQATESWRKLEAIINEFK